MPPRRRLKKKKPEYPPQGGEARICCTLFVAMVLAVLSAVTMIYSSVLVYFPSKRVLESNFQGPKTCTTVRTRRAIHSLEECAGWSSCEEWCLGMAADACSHVWAAVRDPGVEVQLEGCEVSLDHTCSILDDLPDIDCKQHGPPRARGAAVREKNDCAELFDDGVLVSCIAGVCRNVTQVYDCKYDSTLQKMSEMHGGRGFCSCSLCPKGGEVRSQDVCPPELENCLMKANGSCTNCLSCWQICRVQKNCFDLRTRTDPPNLGMDEWERPASRDYHCERGRCHKVFDLQCARKCDSVEVNTLTNNVVILSGERVVAAACSSAYAGKEKVFISADKLLAMACTEVRMEGRKVLGKDCVNGTWLEKISGGYNYSRLTTTFFAMAQKQEDGETIIPNEKGLTLNNFTQLRVNLEGCVNTLSGDCTDFYSSYGRDGRNSTSRSIYQCYYDPAEEGGSEFAVIDFDRAATLQLLVLCLAVPAVIFVVSCSYICVCQQMVSVANDGRMRLRCCGKYVSGIGNVHSPLAPSES